MRRCYYETYKRNNCIFINITSAMGKERTPYTTSFAEAHDTVVHNRNSVKLTCFDSFSHFQFDPSEI